jgi:hypothetical protein
MGGAGNGEGVAGGPFPVARMKRSEMRFAPSGYTPLHRSYRTMRSVGGPKPWFESATLIEPMDAGIGSAALKQDVVAILSPRFIKRSANNRAAVGPPLIVRMSYDVFDDSMLTAAPQEIGNGDQHACRDDQRIRVGYKDVETVTGEGFRPNLFGPLSWLGVTTDVGCPEQREQGGEISGVRDPGIGHLKRLGGKGATDNRSTDAVSGAGPTFSPGFSLPSGPRRVSHAR